MQYPKTLEFDEDSGDALSPDQPASQDSQGSAASPGDIRLPETPSPLSAATIQVGAQHSTAQHSNPQQRSAALVKARALRL